MNAKDLYDCRRRLWYNQAINSPKDIIIALDLSGSMTGNHFDIAKVTIKSLIDTLQQNDFFHIIYSSKDKVNLINSCPEKLLQATSQNKDAGKKQTSTFLNLIYKNLNQNKSTRFIPAH